MKNYDNGRSDVARDLRVKDVDARNEGAKRSRGIITPADEGMRAAKKEAMGEKANIAEIRQLVIEIAERVNEIEVLDPYGDLIEWFETSQRVRITDEVLAILDR